MNRRMSIRTSSLKQKRGSKSTGAMKSHAGQRKSTAIPKMESTNHVVGSLPVRGSMTNKTRRKGAFQTGDKPKSAPQTGSTLSNVTPSHALQAEQTPTDAPIPRSVDHDLTNLPDELDAKYLKIDPEGKLRPTIIKMDPERQCNKVSCWREVLFTLACSRSQV